MFRLGIDPEKPYRRATFICQDGLCCCNMALISFRLFRKNLGNLPDFFGQMVYRPPGKKFPIRLSKNGNPLLFPVTQARYWGVGVGGGGTWKGRIFLGTIV